ncbi:hypothetical protein ABT095_34305 [Kitasatospora sp. NPDC002227]|uniref:hypothetical protein n=1 Tax=Kitasatospora sp. NPDC002227 TaxID=3154773 RepID=UPI003326A1A5
MSTMPSEDTLRLLDTLLRPDDPVHAVLRTHVPHLRVTSVCGCGCDSPSFELDTTLVEPAQVEPGTGIVAEADFVTAEGVHAGEVLVFARGGYLSWLEVCTWDETVEVTVATARQLLCP